ncbi:maleylpyruvate isomerase family mycothiol-dependent enzyme [Actinoplanes sp. URMC 104]|uniref:maleylpyruvate isomerase family mycothiol-dependent enzyme n=1 Tax=Actinoplanes sp. URMC 104 TaxID=3423409 RepID=UPI003F1A8DD4
MTGPAPSVLDAFRDEAAAFVSALQTLPRTAWERPTRCEPWRIRELVGHVVTALGRVPQSVALRAPLRAAVTAVEYFRNDHRFSSAANAERVQIAASVPTADADALRAAARLVVTTCEAEPPARVVETRHGDAMLLSEFLLTRLFELAIHGLDVADAANVPPWLTPAAAHHLKLMLFTVEPSPGDDAALLRRATGRAPLSTAEAAALGLRSLTLG